MKFLLDHDVPAEIGHLLRYWEHNVTVLRTVLPVTASDEEVGHAMAFAFRELKLVVEPGGAVGLAALLSGKIEARGKTVVIVLSGGNVDADLYAKLIA